MTAEVRTLRLSDWMSELPEALWDVPLNQLAIPGSHDSFSFSLDPRSDVGPDDEGGVGAMVKMLGPIAKAKLHSWAVTQCQNFLEQLNSGIRYFDLRVATHHAANGEPHFIHKQFGMKVTDGVQEIYRFLEAHPKEIVILDFNHFYGMSKESHDTLIDKMVEIFGSKLCMFLGVQNVNLKVLWENELQVIMLYHHTVVQERGDLWPPGAIQSFWPSTTSLEKLIKKLDHHHGQERQEDQFYCLQGILTPDTKMILGNLNGSLKDTVARKTTTAFISWLKDKKCGPRGVNICLADFTDIEDFPSKVIDLNYK